MRKQQQVKAPKAPVVVKVKRVRTNALKLRKQAQREHDLDKARVARVRRLDAQLLRYKAILAMPCPIKAAAAQAEPLGTLVRVQA